jgi:pyruvate kinase
MNNDVGFCLEHDIDYIILSIYNGKQEILELKKVILDEIERIKSEEKVPNEIKIIAKLENEGAIKDIEGILEVADCILIPRGLLGTVLPIQKISWI